MRKNLIDFESHKLQLDLENSNTILSPFTDTDIQNYLTIIDYNRSGKPYIANYQRVREYLDDKGYVVEIISELPLVKKYYRFDIVSGYYKEVSEDTMYEDFIRDICSIQSDLYITRNTKAEFLANVLPFLRDTKHLMKSDTFSIIEGLYEDGEVMPFKNGIYSLRYNRLLPRTSCLFIKHHFNVNFNPKSFNNPIGQRYFEIADENEDLFEYLFEQIGYALYCETFRIPTFTVIYGPGSNGKSMIVNAVQRIMGDENISKVSLEGMANAFELAQSEGKKINLVTDSSAGYNESKFAPVTIVPSFMKTCSSGESWQFNPKHKAPHMGIGPAKFIFATNVYLNFSDNSDGMVRRTNAVYLPRVFKEDRVLVKEMESEEAMEWFALQALVSFKNFINNAMNGAEDIPDMNLTGKYIEYDGSMDIKRDMLVSKDVLSDFLFTEKGIDILNIEEVRDKLEGEIDLYKQLKKFCGETGRMCPSQRKMTVDLQSKFKMENFRTTRKDGFVTENYYIMRKM